MTKVNRPIVAVIGASSAPDDVCMMAADIGAEIARHRWHLICGGGDGVMEAACRGFIEAREEPGIVTLGVLPTEDNSFANPFVEVPIPTGMGWARNAVITRTADGVVAIGGCSGTLSEIAFAWQMGKPIAALVKSGGWSQKLAGQKVDGRRQDKIFAAQTPVEAAAFLAGALSDNK